MGRNERSVEIISSFRDRIKKAKEKKEEEEESISPEEKRLEEMKEMMIKEKEAWTKPKKNDSFATPPPLPFPPYYDPNESKIALANGSSITSHPQAKKVEGHSPPPVIETMEVIETEHGPVAVAGLSDGTKTMGIDMAEPLPNFMPFDINDITQFAEKVLNVELTPAQKRFLKIMKTKKTTKREKGKQRTDYYLQQKIITAFDLFLKFISPQYEIRKKEKKE